MDIWVWLFQKWSKPVALWEVLKIVDFGDFRVLDGVDKRASNYRRVLRITVLVRSGQKGQNG